MWREDALRHGDTPPQLDKIRLPLQSTRSDRLISRVASRVSYALSLSFHHHGRRPHVRFHHRLTVLLSTYFTRPRTPLQQCATFDKGPRPMLEERVQEGNLTDGKLQAMFNVSRKWASSLSKSSRTQGSRSEESDRNCPWSFVVDVAGSQSSGEATRERT